MQGEGLFSEEHKRPLPEYPATIVVITSPTGAAIRDIARTLAHRWPAARVYLIPVAVQGEGAAEQITGAIRAAGNNAARLGLEVLIVARGGGSMEDLWCFNEEIVARAIYDCSIPVVTGIGHEIDTTIADLVADRRAATPTAAAMAATPDWREVASSLRQLGSRLHHMTHEQFHRAVAAVRLVERSEFFRNPLHRVRTLQQRLDENNARLRAVLVHRRSTSWAAVDRLASSLGWQLGRLAKLKSDRLGGLGQRLAAINPLSYIRPAQKHLSVQQRHLAMLLRNCLEQRRALVERYHRTLEALSYRNILKRGYSVTRDAAGRILRKAAEAKTGDMIRSELAEGEIRSIVDGAVVARPKPRKKRSAADSSTPGLFENRG